jgi:hypothetical protein
LNIYNRVIKKLKHMIGVERKEPAMNIRCSEFEVDNWLISEFIVKKLIAVAGTHPYPIAELNGEQTLGSQLEFFMRQASALAYHWKFTPLICRITWITKSTQGLSEAAW